MSRRSRKSPPTEAHVRLYAHETRCLAWKTLEPDARALLVELRALYQPSQGNIVYLSIREAGRRLTIGQRRVQRAFDALLARGWIAVHEPGGFIRKTRHATAYRLENEPGASPGAKAPKPYMRWLPESVDENSGSQIDHTR